MILLLACVDTEAPKPEGSPADVSILAPADGAWASGVLPLQAEATDGVTEVAWFVDDGLLARVTLAPWEATWDTSEWQDGLHVVRAIATAGDDQAEDEVTVGVDGTPPRVYDLEPSDGSRVAGVVTLTAIVEEAQALASAEVAVDGVTLCALGTGSQACDWSSTGSTFGAHEVSWRAADQAGSQVEVVASLTVDNPPEVVWVSPAQGDVVSGSVAVDVRATDDEALADLQVRADDVVLDASWDTCALAEGGYTLVAEALDVAGQATVSTIEVEVEHPFSALSEADVVMPGGAVRAWTSSGETVARVEWAIDGVSVGGTSIGTSEPGCELPCPDRCTTWTVDVNLTGVPAGSQLIEVTAFDVVGGTATASATVDIVLDVDGDGYASAEADGDDCDDTTADVNPSAVESCDGIDQDCDGDVDEDFDLDGDGHRSVACADGDDCDDTDASVSPSASADVCDGRDDDCDGWVDNGTPAGGGTASFGSATSSASITDDLYGNVVTPSVDTTLTELWMYLDPSSSADITLVVFESAGASIWSRVASEVLVGDGAMGWYAATGMSVPMHATRSYLLAVESDGYTEVYMDPAAALDPSTELTPGGAIQASSAGGGLGDDPLLADPNPDVLLWQDLTLVVLAEEDQDRDADGSTLRCGDCDDEDDASAPGLPEACDGDDNDCDGAAVDEGDDDDDGFRVCEGDCDDADPQVYPGAAELCDGVDGDCDGAAVDEEDGDSDGYRVCDADCDDADPTVTLADNYLDADGDGYGDATTRATTCPPPAGYVSDDTDCDDGDATVSPGVAEACDGRDDDCDGLADEGYADADGDTWAACLDCDDASAAINPDTAEICGDTVDEDCDGLAPRCRWSGEQVLTDVADRLYGETGGDAAGYGVAAGQDLDGDGGPDLAIGGTSDDDGGSSAGAVWLVYGDPGGDLALSRSDAKLIGESAGDQAGASVALLGDTDGDGLGEVLVGAWRSAASASYAGAAYLVSAPASGDVDLSAATARLLGADSNDYLGISAVGSADLDGDGAPDGAVGAASDETTGSGAGTVYLFPGTTSGDLLATDAVQLWGEDANDAAGTGLGAGDFDGDGVGDLLITAPTDDDGGANAGAVYLVFGPIVASLDLSAADAKWTGAAVEDRMAAAAPAGDTDGDGTLDIVMGSAGHDANGSYSGVAHIVRGPSLSGGSVIAADATLVGPAAQDLAGTAVSSAGDVDADGHDDVIVGGQGYSTGAYAGGVWLVYGPQSGSIELLDEATFEGAQGNDYAGYALTAAGDVDGDGADDVLIGAYGDDRGGSGAGAGWLLRGTP